MFNWIDKKTQLLTRKVLHGCPRRLRPPALELFRQQSSLGKIGKEEPWTLEIISHWSDKLSSILDYFTFDPQKKYFTNLAQKSGAICLSRPRIPRVSEFRSPYQLRRTLCYTNELLFCYTNEQLFALVMAIRYCQKPFQF